MNLSNPPMRTEASDCDEASRYTDLTLIARQPATSSGVRRATGDLYAPDFRWPGVSTAGTVLI